MSLSWQRLTPAWLLLLSFFLRRSDGQTKIENECLLLSCCEDDCCGKGTRWSVPKAHCVLDPSSDGFNGTHPPFHDRGCVARSCCESTCCDIGTQYNISLGCCLPIVSISTPRPNITLSNSDPNTEPRRLSYESDLIPFTNLLGKRSAIVQVGLSSLGIPSTSPTPPIPRPPLPPTSGSSAPSQSSVPSMSPLDPLDQLQVTAEIVTEDGNNLPVFFRRVGNFLTGIVDDILPEKLLLGLKLKVVAPIASTFKFFTRVVTEVIVSAREFTDDAQSQLGDPSDVIGDILTKLNKGLELLSIGREIAKNKDGILEVAMSFLDEGIITIKDGYMQLSDAQEALKDLPESVQNHIKKFAAESLGKVSLARAEVAFIRLTGKVSDVPFLEVVAHAAKTEFLPFTNRIFVKAGDERNGALVIREYGRAMLFTKVGDLPPSRSYPVNRPSSEEIAWIEGWASFFSCVVRNDSEYVDADGNLIDIDVRFLNNRAVRAEGADVQTNVQSLLWDIFDEEERPFSFDDEITVPFAILWDCIAEAKPDNLEKFLASLKTKLDESDQVALIRSARKENHIHEATLRFSTYLFKFDSEVGTLLPTEDVVFRQDLEYGYECVPTPEGVRLANSDTFPRKVFEENDFKYSLLSPTLKFGNDAQRPYLDFVWEGAVFGLDDTGAPPIFESRIGLGPLGSICTNYLQHGGETRCGNIGNLFGNEYLFPIFSGEIAWAYKRSVRVWCQEDTDGKWRVQLSEENVPVVEEYVNELDIEYQRVYDSSVKLFEL